LKWFVLWITVAAAITNFAAGAIAPWNSDVYTFSGDGIEAFDRSTGRTVRGARE
jgi:hypothetical protein